MIVKEIPNEVNLMYFRHDVDAALESVGSFMRSQEYPVIFTLDSKDKSRYSKIWGIGREHFDIDVNEAYNAEHLDWDVNTPVEIIYDEEDL